MNSHGQIDQIITSIIVVFVAIFLSGVFLGVSSNVAQVAGYSSTNLSASTLENKGNSRALLDVFVTDSVLIKDELVRVYDALPLLAGPEGLVISQEIESLFEQRYSCGGLNAFAIRVLDSFSRSTRGTDVSFEGTRVTTYIDYPFQHVSSESFGLSEDIFDEGLRTTRPRSFDSDTFAFLSVGDVRIDVLARGVLCP